MQICIACGMSMNKTEDFGNHDITSEFCIHCMNRDGSIKSCEEIFEWGVGFFMAQTWANNILAEKIVRKNMRKLQHRQGGGHEMLEGPVATDDEFSELLQRMQED